MPNLSTAVRELAVTLATLPHTQRAALKRDFATSWSLSPSTLSRKLQAVGCRSHSRADKGKRRTGIDDSQLQCIAALQATSKSLRKGIVMPAKDAIEIAAQNGLAPTISPSVYNGWLRQQSGTRRDQVAATPHVELRSLGPNHVHQVDFSLAINWRVENNRPMYEHLLYKNKLPAAGVPRVLRMLVVDHATGCFYAHYTASAGETVQALLEGLYYAWTEKFHKGESITRQYPFRGVPAILMADRGSAMQSAITAAVMNRLGVTLNICEGARSKGAVEVAHNWWEAHFESRFRTQPPESIEQLNEWAMGFAARYCATETHSRHQSQRSTMWAWYINRRPESRLRELRCSFEQFKAIALTEPQRCKVGGARIVRFRSARYRVPEEFLPNSYVEVQYSPFNYPQVQVRAEGDATGAVYLCSPVEVDEFGFARDAATIGSEFKSQKHTQAQRFAATAAAESKTFEGKVQAFGYHLEQTPAIAIPAKGEEVPVADVAAAVMTRVAARQYVIDILGRALNPAEAEYLGQTFGDAVTEAEALSAVDEIQRGIRARVVQFAVR